MSTVLSLQGPLADWSNAWLVATFQPLKAVKLIERFQSTDQSAKGHGRPRQLMCTLVCYFQKMLFEDLNWCRHCCPWNWQFMVLNQKNANSTCSENCKHIKITRVARFLGFELNILEKCMERSDHVNWGEFRHIICTGLMPTVHTQGIIKHACR